MTAPSEELLRRASRGEESALRRLVELHQPNLLAFVRARMGPELRAFESVRDVLQDVLLKVVMGVRAAEFRDEAAFRGWLYTVAERQILDRVRYHGREKRRTGAAKSLSDEAVQETLLLEAYSNTDGLPERLGRMEEIQQLERAFEKLPDQDREVLTLTFFCGMNSAQVAEQLGISADTARKRKTRARVRLAALWNASETD